MDTECKSERIVEKILNSKEYIKSNIVGVYSPYQNEVNLNDLIVFAFKDNKIIAIPVVLNESDMIFCKINSLSDLTNLNKYHIKEPIINNNMINPQDLNLIITPGICFDKNKNRIGYGKGYYDRYLKKCSNSYNVGVCYDEQIVKDCYIKCNEYDKALDEIITDKRKII